MPLLDIDPASITKLTKGTQDPKAAWLPLIANFFGETIRPTRFVPASAAPSQLPDKGVLLADLKAQRDTYRTKSETLDSVIRQMECGPGQKPVK